MQLLPIVALALTIFSVPQFAVAATVSLAAGTGAMSWDTTTSVTSPLQNTAVTHPLFPGNRHTHEGWFLYVQEFGILTELTNFSSVSDGVSQDVISATSIVLGETFNLELSYGLSAVGPDGLPQLDWSGSISRMSPASPLQLLTVRLFNVFDYDIGTAPGSDSAIAMQTTGPDTTVIEIDGLDGISGGRGVYGLTGYTADTRANVLDQVILNNVLNNSAAPGNYDVAGAFQWTYVLCKDPSLPECQGTGNGSGQMGGFGNFGAVPEPSTAALVVLGLGGMARRRRPTPQRVRWSQDRAV
ncbi:MAG: PEP-CTERM sorting domain-containing protein [Myxococcota bacterium]